MQPGPAELDERLLVLVENEAVLRAIESKLVKGGAHLRGEREIGRGALLFAEMMTLSSSMISVSPMLFRRGLMNPYAITSGESVVKKLRDSGNAVADDVVQQFPRQPANPMLLVAEKRSRIPGPSELIAVVALHVDRRAAQKAAPDQRTHAARRVAELVVMSRGDLEALVVGQCDQTSGVVLVERERLLHINMAARFQAAPGDLEMALRRRGDVNYIRPAPHSACSPSR